MILLISASFLVLLSQSIVHGGGFFSSGLKELESSIRSDIIWPNVPISQRRFLPNGQMDMRVHISYWPDGVVYYRLAFREKKKIRYFSEAFEEIERKTCVR